MNVLVFGAGGHAKVIAEAISSAGGQVVGFVDEIDASRHGETFCGSRVIGSEEAEAIISRAPLMMVFAGFGDNSARMRVIERWKPSRMATVIHPKAILAGDVQIGAGSCVLAGAVVNAGAQIGQGVIVNSHALVEHDCVVGDGAHIAPGARLAGGVRVGALATVGLGALVREHLEVGPQAFVGAGALVLDHVEAGTLVYGSPARFIRRIERNR